MNNIISRDIIFIINPYAGKGSNVSRITKKINDFQPDITTVIAKDLLELDKIYSQQIEKFKIIIIVGGDGTVNNALRYFVNRRDKVLGVLPTGSGNGFSRELGFSKSIKSLYQDIIKGETIDLDVLSVNNELCINVAGLGFDSYVAHRFQRSKGRGLKNYVLITIKSIFTFKPFYAEIDVDGLKLDDKYLMINMANTRQFGNNAIIAPHAKPNDGMIELVLVKPMPPIYYAIFIVKLFLGFLKTSKYLEYIQVKEKLVIYSDFNLYHIDGEPKSSKNPLSISIISNSIKVIKTKYNNLQNSI